jgi:glycolate oxidase
MRFSAIIRQLKKIAGANSVLDRPEDLLLYEYDGGMAKSTPKAVVFPRTTEEVSAIMRLATAEGLSVVPRGAGTGLSGGAIAREGSIILGFSRMNRILEIDLPNQRAVVQPGVVNLELTDTVSPQGFYFAPDPSSQKACTIGGNVAENSGGPHTLAYGVTVNHVTGVEVVLPDGRVVEFGGKALDGCGYDLAGFFVGSEGTLGIATKITVKLSRLPEKVATLLGIFNTVEDAAQTVASITAEGITPAALEMLDQIMLRAIEDYVHAGYPKDAAAVLLIELEGLTEAVADQVEAVRDVCQRQHAREVRVAQDEHERHLLWAGRKGAFGAVGRIAPSCYVQDGVIPRTRVPEMLRYIEDVSRKYGLAIGNVFHAGDGNLHPLILFDGRDPKQTRDTIEAGKEILQRCAEIGGSITGEHGVGMEKNDYMPMLFTADDLDLMSRLRDVFNPHSTLNPQKVLPSARMCMEVKTPLYPGVVDSGPIASAPISSGKHA